MPKLLIIADDLTGALDTGIQFVRKGISTCVETNIGGRYGIDFSKADVIVVNSETRHTEAKKAYAAVRKIAETGLSAGAELLYKKTDSALRGNIGAELKAVSDAAGKSVYFVPAYPKMERITKNGIHYCGGVKVSDSSFGKDPVDPVLHSRVDEIIGEEWEAETKLVSEELLENELNGEEKVLIFDCTCDRQMRKIFAATEKRQGIMAGCAGFAEQLAENMGFSPQRRKTELSFDGMYTVCGSMNPASAAQVEFACQNGFEEVSLSREQIEKKDYAMLKKAMAESRFAAAHTLRADFSSLAPAQIAEKLGEYHGEFLHSFLKEFPHRLAVVIGGDTLMGVMQKIACEEIVPLMALPGGAVLSVLSFEGRKVPIVSKSGGFGEKEWLLQLCESLQIKQFS